MYIPKSNLEDHLPVLQQFMQDYNFAILVSQQDGQLSATHLPVLLDTSRGEYGVVIAHLARANPQWKSFENGQEVMVIFQGPHAYVSPTWYETHPSVPTWNYAIVHAYGLPHIVNDQNRLHEMLSALVHHHEDPRDPSWEMKLPDDYMSKMMASIVGFEIEITRLEGKYKLSQNRSETDQINVIENLSQSAYALDIETADLMRDRRAAR
jgi:transcriptional regulator